MAAGHILQPIVEIGHGQEGFGVPRPGILGDQISGWPIVSVEGDAVAGKVE